MLVWHYTLAFLFLYSIRDTIKEEINLILPPTRGWLMATTSTCIVIFTRKDVFGCNARLFMDIGLESSIWILRWWCLTSFYMYMARIQRRWLAFSLLIFYTHACVLKISTKQVSTLSLFGSLFYRGIEFFHSGQKLSAKSFIIARSPRKVIESIIFKYQHIKLKVAMVFKIGFSF